MIANISSVKVADNGKSSRRRSFVKTLKHAFTRSSSSDTVSINEGMSVMSIDMASSHSMKSDIKKRKKVRFNTSRSHQRVYKIQPLFDYASELWWSREDIERCRSEQSDFSSAPYEVQVNAKAYMGTYEKARREVFRSNKDNPSQTLSAAVYNELVSGRSLGFAALEIYGGSIGSRRRQTIKTVTSIATTYYDCVVLSYCENSEEQVRRYSRSLTATDRRWAQIIGNADSIAAAAVHNNNNDDINNPACSSSLVSSNSIKSTITSITA
jgi:hypothetical protein